MVLVDHHSAGRPVVVTPPGPSIADRLHELETLRATRALTEPEYAGRRSQIIAET